LPSAVCKTTTFFICGHGITEEAIKAKEGFYPLSDETTAPPLYHRPEYYVASCGADGSRTRLRSFDLKFLFATVDKYKKFNNESQVIF